MSFEITHPFHPRRGERFPAAARRPTWGEDRLTYFDARGRLRSILTSWTSLADEDVFLRASAGRSWFRVDDLAQLSALLEAIRAGARR